MLNQAGLRTTLPYLEDLTARWESSNASIQSPLWREADELSRHMLRLLVPLALAGGRQRRSRPDARFADPAGERRAHRCVFAEQSAEGHYAAPDNGAIVRAAALIPAPRATELLVRIVSRNAPDHLSACGDLLLRCVAAPTGATGDLEQIGVAFDRCLAGRPDQAGAGRALGLGQRR